MTKGKSLVELGFIRIYKKHLDRLRSGKLKLAPLPPGFPNSNEYLGGEPTVHIKNPSFTIISNNSWSNAVYKRLNYLYQTPFVGTYIADHDYFKLLNNLEHYLESPLTFIDRTETNLAASKTEDKQPLVGILGGEIKIQFQHQNNETEALSNWLRRLKKVNWDNLFICYCCDRHTSTVEQLEFLAEFERLDFPYKLAFTPQEYPQFNSAVWLNNYGVSDYDTFKASATTFDIIAWLNKTRGSNTQEYVIDPSYRS